MQKRSISCIKCVCPDVSERLPPGGFSR